MSAIFSDNAYSRATKEQQTDWDEFCREISQKTQFSYGETSFEEYSEEYRSEGWLGRKVVALPKAMVGIVVETITFLANIIFDGIQKICGGETKPLTVHFYTFIRGLEGVVGLIVTLFHDRLGSFLINDATFQKECYHLIGRTLPKAARVSFEAVPKSDITNYQSPFSKRYASPEMRLIFSDQTKFSTWRRFWLALAEAQKELGLEITETQLEEMRAHLDDINIERADELEKELRHDVMAHVNAWKEQCPEAAKIIHLGATSMYVCDNTELLQMQKAMEVLRSKLLTVIEQLAEQAEKYKDTPCLAHTHYQPAQPTTVGKRITMWLESFVMNYRELDHSREEFSFLGCKGATGTQASFLHLFEGDHEKVKELEELIAKKMGLTKLFQATGQTYHRLQDVSVLHVLSQMAVSSHKFALDMRLLAHEKEMEEPFGKKQIGSSAMAYKRNPMNSERIDALSTFVRHIENISKETSSWQMLERTLDDSASRRIVNPMAFLAMDEILTTMIRITKEPVVYEAMCQKHLQAELPFMATENILMYLVEQKGKDRQEMHEKIRVLSQQAGQRVKMHGEDNNLLELLVADEDIGLTKEELDTIMDVKKFIGRAPEQTEEFLRDVVRPLIHDAKKS